MFGFGKLSGTAHFRYGGNVVDAVSATIVIAGLVC